MKNLLLRRLEQVMEEANANRRWSKVHASIRGFFSFLARRGGRRNKKAKVPGEDGDSSYTPASSIISENGELPAMSNRDKPVDTADVQELSLDENIATIDAPELSLHEIIAKTDNFSSMSCIGQGSHARVYYAATENKRQMAVKKLDKPPKRVSRHELFTNIATASRLRHENFVELLGYHAGDDLLLLAYEFASMGSLHDILHGRKGVQGSQRGAAMPWSRRARIALDAARGLEYLHQNGIIHRNIRSSNVLLFHGFGAKIADYNLFNQAPDMATRHPSTRVLGSFAYHPPEYVMFGVMAQTSDVYSFGVVLLELLTGRKPVDVKMPSGHQSLVNWATPNLTPEKVKEIVDPRLNREYPAKGAAKLAATAAVCLQFEPDSRPEMSVVVRALQAAAKYEI